MKNKLFLSLVACSIALNMGFIGVYGFNMLHGKEPVAPQNCPFTSKYTHLYTALGLSRQQLEAIEPLAGEFHKQAESIGKHIVKQRNSLVEAMAQELVDKSVIDAIHRDIAERQSVMQQLVVSHLLEMKDLMTPEQRVMFFSAMQRSFQAHNFMNH